MLDHVGINVSDYERSREFYARALAPLGFSLLMEPVHRTGGYGREGKPWFWITDQREPGTKNVHIAFTAQDRATVDAFHRAALEAGGTDNGAPGVREIYHPTYYGAFVFDLDGNNIEVVCHKPHDQPADAKTGPRTRVLHVLRRRWQDLVKARSGRRVSRPDQDQRVWNDGSIASDSAGDLYATWDTQAATGGHHTDTGWVSFSTDGGRHWSAPVQAPLDRANAPHIMEVIGAGPGKAYVGWLSSSDPRGWAMYLRTLSVSANGGLGGWLSRPTRVSRQFGDPGVFPGDTFGISTLAPNRLVLSWGSAVSRSRRKASVFAAPVTVHRR